MGSEIVGRDAELAVIEAWLDEPTPSVLMLEGEAGIGKSTLWRAGVSEARERGYRVLSSSASRSEAELSFAALRDLIDEIFDDVVEELPAPQRHALAVVLLREEPEPDQGPPEPATIGIAFRSTLRALATRGPTMVAIDDVQWLDRSSADVLAYTARRLGDAPAVADAQERAQRAAELGEGVRYLRTTFLPGDETVLHLFEAPSVEALDQAGRRAALPFERIVEAVEGSAEAKEEER